MARKDDMLKAFLSNTEFCHKYDITANPDIAVYQALQCKESPALVALAKIIDKYEEDNITPLYQQVITLLNEKL